MKQRDILFISISAFVVIVFWIGFNIYHNLAITTISEPLEKNIIPISPNFDLKSIEAIKNKASVQPIFETEAASGPSQLIFETQEEISQTSESAGGVSAP